MAQHAQNISQTRHELELMLRLREHIESDAGLTDAVLICIDCEAYERDQSKVTEIGVAVLDTCDIASDERAYKLPTNQTPDDSSWIAAKIKSIHLRPVEFCKMLNRIFVKGREDGFVFGSTTWIRQVDLSRVLTRIFHDPSRLAESVDFRIDDIPNQDRNIVLVGHGVKNDIGYMSSFGFDPRRCSRVVRTIDTPLLAGATKKAKVSLHRLLLSLNVLPENLHNGGNDAVYTMQALLTMVLKERLQAGSIADGLAQVVGKLPKNAPKSDTKAVHVWGGTANPEDLNQPDEPPFSFPAKTRPSLKMPHQPALPITDDVPYQLTDTSIALKQRGESAHALAQECFGTSKRVKRSTGEPSAEVLSCPRD